MATVTNSLPLPPGAKHEIVCKFTSLLNFRRTIAELPIKGLQFSKTLNTPGPWSGSLNVEDPKVRKSPWLAGTAVNRSALWVDIDGALVYGGPTQSRRYQESTGVATLGGADFSSYFSQRIQAKDYTAYTDPELNGWAAGRGAPVARIAYYMLTQALEKAYSIPIKVVTSGPTPEEAFWMNFSAPLTQHQALGSILSQMTSLGFMVGIDYACDTTYSSAGVPQVTVTLSYPRRGSGPPVVIDLSNDTELQYDEDGTQQADLIIEQAGATEDRSSVGIWNPAREAGYPLLEATTSHPSLAPTQVESIKILEAYTGGDLVQRAYPLTAPIITLPMFGSPSIFELDTGMDVLVRIPKTAGSQPQENPLFPTGFEALFRIVRIDCEVPEAGVATMALTLNLPPSITPVEPPETRRGEEAGGNKKEGEEKSPAEVAEEKAEEEKAEAEKKAEETAQKERVKEIKEGREKRIKEHKEKEEKREKTEKEAKEAFEKSSGGGSKMTGPIEPSTTRSFGVNINPSASKDALVVLELAFPAADHGHLATIRVGGEKLSDLETEYSDRGLGFVNTITVTVPVPAGKALLVENFASGSPSIVSTYFFLN